MSIEINIDSASMKKSLGLDPLVVMDRKSIRLAQMINDGIDSRFYSWARKSDCDGFLECFEPHKASDFWEVDYYETDYGVFNTWRLRKPAGYTTVSLRSRDTFDYGYFAMRITLPSPSSNAPVLWFGFEADDCFGGGVAHYRYDWNTGTLQAYVGNEAAIAINSIDAPSDATSALHWYEIIVKPWAVFHFIDGKLKSIIIRGVGDTEFSKGDIWRISTSATTISIGVTQSFPTKNLAVLIDIDGGDTSVDWVWETIHPWNIRVAETPPDLPIMMPLFGENGEYPRGLSNVSSFTSMPVPGIGETTIIFAASADGTIELQAVTDLSNPTFRGIETINYTADKYVKIEIKRLAQFVRLVYTPSTTATIYDAHVVMV